MAQLAVAVDVFQHHNRVIDQNPNAQRQPAQRHDVEVNIEEVHADEGSNDGDGYGQADDEGILEVSEEVNEGDKGEHAS